MLRQKHSAGRGQRLALAAAAVAAAGLVLAGALALLSWTGLLSFRGEEVVIDGDGVRLAATLALPRKGKGPFPAAVILHGSGPVIRRDLRAYGGRLAPDGMAVLMYDKRGTGDSTGTHRGFNPATCAEVHDELARDALAAVDYLRGRPDIDPQRIGLIGGSQAGWVMALAASRSDAVRFLVALAGPAVSCGRVQAYQLLTGVQGGQPSGLTLAENEAAVAAVEVPAGFEPAPLLAGLEIPVLWILAGEDANVPTRLTADVLEELRRGGRRNIQVEMLPGADHDLRHAVTGELVDPWPVMSVWLRREGMLDPPGGDWR